MASQKDNRGFAGMDRDEQRKIASMGGKAAHEQGVAHEFNHREAVEAGRKGGESVSKDRGHMAQIGRMGGEATGGHRGSSHESRSSEGSSHGGSSGSSGGSSHRSSSKDEGASKSGYGEKGRAFLEKEIKHHVDDKGMPQDQAVASAMSEARRKGYKVPEEK